MKIKTRLPAIVAAAAAIAVGSVGLVAAVSATPSSNALQSGQGIPEFGMTGSFYAGHVVSFTYTKGFYCDTSVNSTASSGCEGGSTYKKAPAKSFDPLYITVPLGFNVPAMSMECPANLVCVSHPGTIDLRRLETALKPLYPQLTAAQLTAALANFATPGHNHFITNLNNGKPEWWNVDIIGVTSLKEWNAINAHASYTYLHQQVVAKKTTGIIPTNLFLYFGVK